MLLVLHALKGIGIERVGAEEMKEDTSVVARLSTFREAAKIARDRAMQRKQTTRVVRCSDKWEVLAVATLSELLDESNIFESEDAENYDLQAEDAYRDEVQRELMDEIQGDQNDWERSGDTGWYYSDE